MAATDDTSPSRPTGAEQLQQIAAQIQSFLSRQIDRLEQEISTCAPATEEHAELEAMLNEFRQERADWEQEKLQEQRRIHEDSQRLIEAWQRLEAEQRELLKQRALKKTMTNSTTASMQNVSTTPASSRQEPVTTGISSVASPGPTASATGISHRNQLQFQQLRREMLEHARQGRKR
jgi:hypothetical protein